MHRCWACECSDGEILLRLGFLARLTSTCELFTYVCSGNNTLLHQFQILR